MGEQIRCQYILVNAFSILFNLDYRVRGLLEEPVKRPTPVRDFLEEDVELLSIRSLAVRRAQSERQEVQHGGNDESARAAHLIKFETFLLAYPLEVIEKYDTLP